MNSIYLETLSLLADSLNDRPIEGFNPEHWPDIFAELQAHVVTALVAKNISNLNLSAEDKLAFMKILGRRIQIYNKILIEQEKVLDALNEAGIDVVVLKGTSAARYYTNPEYRTMGDVDILVNLDDFDKAHSVMESLTYIPDPEEDRYMRHTGFHNVQGLEVELHRFFSSIGSSEEKEYLDNRLYFALKNSKDYVLPEVENGLVLIGHVGQHLRSGLGLRQIIDWMMYAKANLTDEFWKNEFSEPAKKSGFETLAKVTTAMCVKYLGLDIGITWCSDVPDKKIDALMEYVMEQGNFGRKQEENDTVTSTVLNNFRNPVVFFRYLQSGGKSHWKLARTNKIFGCFAWIYQIGHMINRVIVRRVGISNLKNSQKISKNRVELMKELGIKDY